MKDLKPGDVITLDEICECWIVRICTTSLPYIAELQYKDGTRRHISLVEYRIKKIEVSPMHWCEVDKRLLNFDKPKK